MTRTKTRKPEKSPQTENEINAEETDAPEVKTDRAIERAEEDQEYTPVIVKRTDEARRHPDDILEKTINEGLEQLNRPFLSLLLSAVAAGLILGFSVMAVAIVESHMSVPGQAISSRFLTAPVYPLGFVLCIISGTQLFTEHTATAVYPVLDRRGKLKDLLRLWATVLVGNLIGAFFIAVFLIAAEEVIGAQEGYLAIGQHLVGFSNGSLVISAVLAGWLMALGAWLVMGAQSTLSQMVSIYIVTFLIGLGGLHHSIAGSVEIFVAYLISDSLSAAQVMRFLSMAVCGNLVGGSIFVALLNYGYIRETQKKNQE